MEDAKMAEGLISLGSAEYMEVFGIIWKTTGDAGLAEKEAVKYMFVIRKDLDDLRNKMHNPNRAYANRWVNTGFMVLDKLRLSSFRIF